MHIGSAFGNLIALPLNKKWVAQWNTCFLDPDTAKPITDQWEVLEEIERTSSFRLDQIYSSLQANQMTLEF